MLNIVGIEYRKKHGQCPSRNLNYALQHPGCRAKVLSGINSHFPSYSVEILKANSHPAFSGKGQIQIIPGKQFMNILTEALGGKFKNDSFGVSFLPEKNVVSGILEILSGKQVPANNSQKLVKSLSESRVRARNLSNLISGRQLEAYDESPTTGFIDLLKKEALKLEQTMDKVGLGEKSKKIMRVFIAKTAPVMHTMGYPDHVSHPVQVARAMMIQAKKEGQNEKEILQAGIVGFIHDPKFPAAESFENLATHPVVASSITKEALSSPEMQSMLEEILGGAKNARTFINGAAKALFTNNDSWFVVNNVLLKKVQENPKVLYKEEISEIANRRINFKPSSFETRHIRELDKVKFETGIKFINKEVFEEALGTLRDKHSITEPAEEVFNRILNGDRGLNREFLAELCTNLNSDRKNIGSVDIKASKLFFSPHTDFSSVETSSELTGFKVAKLLEVIDQQTLSFHKILPTKPAIVPAIMKEYAGSFNYNIKNMENLSSEQGNKAKILAVDVYKSILKTLDELTGQNLLSEFEKANQSNPPEKQLENICAVLTNPNIWGAYKSMSAPRAGKSSDQKFEQLLEKLKKNYDEALENSAGMFALR